MKINKEYISNLPYAKSNTLQPVNGESFAKALIKTFGKAVAGRAMTYLMFTMPNNHSGTEAFKLRFQDAVADGTPLSVEDQKYIADVTHRIAYGTLQAG